MVVVFGMVSRSENDLVIVTPSPKMAPTREMSLALLPVLLTSNRPGPLMVAPAKEGLAVAWRSDGFR